MKKLTTLLLLIVSFLSNSSKAQDSCDASFNVTYLNGNTLQFNPAMPGDPVNTHHYWYFGDGANSSSTAPAHTYTGGSVFTVLHFITRTDSTFTTTCRDSFYRTVQVQNTPVCNLTANFYSYLDTTISVPYTYQFQNTSIPLHNNDSILWTFGDGTSSGLLNPQHSYAQPGTYTVCLIVRQRDSLGLLTNCVSEICHAVTVVQAPVNCNHFAGFYSYQDTTNTANLVYQFVNTSQNIHNTDSIRWTYGDGTSSGGLNPSHTYAQPGTYIACLRIQHRDSLGILYNCVSEICHSIIVVQTQAPCNLTANFYAYQDTTVANTHTYQFVNTTVPLNNTDSIIWTFGDGTYSSQVHPIHTYAQPGTYNVCLSVYQTNPNGGLTNCYSHICHTITVVQAPVPCNLIAAFYSYADTTSGTANTYHFQNTSVGLTANDSIRWTFGDGTSSNQVNPNHVYAQPGTYTVCLRVQKRDSTGTLTNCISQICHDIIIAPVCNIHSNFSWIVDSVNNKTIHYTNLTTPFSPNATYLWNLGDGTTSTALNPVHTYSQPGTYNVCLYVQLSQTCNSYTCHSVTITGPPVNCLQQSNFSFASTSGNSQLFTFTPISVNNNAQYTWTFGDGTGNHNITTTHQYAQAGNYTACLTVFQNANCASTTCRPIHVTPQVNCDSVGVYYNYHADSSFPNKIYFQAVSNYTLTDQTWTIYGGGSATPLATLHQNNPSYTFSDSGYYYVCLRAKTATGCIKDYCRYIYISNFNGNNTCNLQTYPNPATNAISVNVALNTAQMIHVYVYNSANIQVKQKHQQGYAGVNAVNLHIANLMPGFYTMKVIHGNSICYAKFVKL